MNLQTAPFDGNFDAIDKTHADRLGSRPPFGQATDIIVVGQGKQGNAVGCRPAHEIGGRQKAVGSGGMAVEIDDGH